jgi:hypothetical protein
MRVHTLICGTNRYALCREVANASGQGLPPVVQKAAMEITPILPPGEDTIDFDVLDCMVKGPEISIIEDRELSITNPPSVVELIGADSTITFFADCSRQYLVLNVKGMERFLTIILHCVDDIGETKTITLTNKASFVTADRQSCKLPLVLEEGWQYLCIDLEDLLANAFSATFASCREVTVCGSCRLSKLYFQSRKYADVELPKYLRVLGNE